MQVAKYDKIGTGYNSTRQADTYLTQRLLFHLQPEHDKHYLDLGCGTGNYTIALAEKGFHFTGLDPSKQMLDEARSKNQQITWLRGTAELIPSEDNAYDGIIATLTIHHWTDLKKAFSEINRVLTENGRLVLFTSTPGQMKNYWLNHYFPQMLQSSIGQMPSVENIKEAISKTELKITAIEKYYIKDDLKDCFLYVGKNKPELYFDETIRNGISSFSSLANSEEVKNGLARLRNDLKSHTFEGIKEQFANELGDYLFLTISKKANPIPAA
jgi:ubiquinone/menaquinone biosynthesis C-methylase UbiE